MESQRVDKREQVTAAEQNGAGRKMINRPEGGGGVSWKGQGKKAAGDEVLKSRGGVTLLSYPHDS